jgi:glycosyltransferase involved in cell wall biosynthesis
MSAPAIILDLSRLLLRASQRAPTGIDRVELAYAEYLLVHEPHRLHFAAIHPLGHPALLPQRPARRFVEMISRHWSMPGGDPRRLLLAGQVLLQGTLLRPRLGDAWNTGSNKPTRPIYLNVSHHQLNRPRVIERLKRQGTRFVCLVHDLIPMQLPEYVRPRAAARHRRRIDTVARLSDGIICNSAATRDSLAPYLGQAGRAPPLVVAQLGVAAAFAPPAPAPDRAPYFVCLGTIEPRKNHLLLLNIWRRLAEQGGVVPRLLLAGRRGWENENALDMIDRCGALAGLVEQRHGLSDEAVRSALRGARALLFPSFAEGYGLPLAEALALGVPVLCSDLPVLREVGGDVPDYLDPLDGMGWMTAVRDYASRHAPRRDAQLARLAAWRPPSWDRHVRQALDLIDHDLAEA